MQKHNESLAAPPAGGSATPVRVPFQSGDVVTHRYGDWGTDTMVIESVNSEQFSDDPVAFFVGGGFWRTSRLKLVAHAPDGAGARNTEVSADGEEADRG